MSETWVLHQIAVEIKYRKGFVFLDKCGSLMVRLEEELGQPFKGTVPTMEFGQLQSAAEFLTVRYGPKNVNVTQMFPETVARVEQIAPRAWSQVSDALGIGQEVSRCGVRFWLMWAARTIEEGEATVARAGFFNESPKWTALFGSPSKRTFTGVHVGQDDRGIRAEIRVVTTSVEGPPLSDALAKRSPPVAVLLDLDFFFPPEEGRVSLHANSLKDFIRSSWERAKIMAGSATDVLGGVGIP